MAWVALVTRNINKNVRKPLKSQRFVSNDILFSDKRHLTPASCTALRKSSRAWDNSKACTCSWQTSWGELVSAWHVLQNREQFQAERNLNQNGSCQIQWAFFPAFIFSSFSSSLFQWILRFSRASGRSWCSAWWWHGNKNLSGAGQLGQALPREEKRRTGGGWGGKQNHNYVIHVS